MTKRPITVLVADDSPTLRNALTALIDETADLRVVGHAEDGVEAVEKAAALRPDVITMDVLMPRLDGLGAVARIMAETPSRILVVASVAEERITDLSMRALALGALELIPKPDERRPSDLRSWGRQVVDSIRLMGEVPVVTRRRGTAMPLTVPVTPGDVAAFGIAASTGGPQALVAILSALPADLPVPLLVAQHIAEGFTAGLMRWFASVSPLRFAIARAGELPQKGCVYLPPDGNDLMVDYLGLIKLQRSPGGHCPSGDRLLESMAYAYGRRAGGAVLSGMGEDGARGLLAIRDAGGVTVAQDEASCVVFGMPNAALRLRATDLSLPAEAIGPFIRRAATGRAEGRLGA